MSRFLGYIILLASLFISGCGLGFEDEGTDPNEIRDRNRLQKSFAQVIGSYSGTVTTGTDSFEVEVSIYKLVKSGGVNDRGEEVPRDILQARYRRLDVVEEDGDYILNVRYYDNGQITMFAGGGENPSSPGQGAIFTIEGQVQKGKLTGSVFKTEGKIGDLNAILVSRDVRAPSEEDEVDERRRLYRMFKTVAGIYSGPVQNEEGQVLIKEAEIQILIREAVVGTDANGKPRYRPILRATYRRPDDLREEDLSVKYFPKAQELVLISAKAEGAFDFYSMYGQVENKQLKLEIWRDDGYFGVYTGQRIKRDDNGDGSRVDKERQRLIKIFEKIQGTFRGFEVEPGRGGERFPVRLEVYIFEEDRGTDDNGQPVLWPSLRARFVREDYDNPSLHRLLKIYYSTSGDIVMRNTGPTPPPTVPGAWEFTIRGKINKDYNKITGQISDHRGPRGQLVLSKDVN